MAHRRRSARQRSRRPAAGRALGVASALVTALATAFAVAGCTSVPAGPARSGAPGRPAVTLPQARQAWDHYVTVSARAARTSDRQLALTVVTGALRAVVAATLASHSVTVQGGPANAAYRSSLTITSSYGQYSYGTPAFYLPEQSGYPHFFVAAATAKLAGDPSAGAGAGALVSVDGAAVRPLGPELMLFEQASAGAPWLLGGAATLAVGESLPKLATDSAGYVPAVTPSAAALLAKPDEVGALQAAVVDDGPTSAASRAVADGQLTTGLYQGALSHADGLTAPHGDIYQWELEGTNYPGFALRTATGGALVFYTMALDTTVAVPDYISKADPVHSGPPIQVPAEVRRLLPPGQPAPLIDLESEQMLSFAAVDPASTGGKIQVIAVGGSLTSATAS